MANTFQIGATGTYGLYTGVYLWSNTANWVGAAKPANGGNATFSANTSLGNPTGVDDIANLFLDKLTMPTGYLAVVGALEIGTLSLGNSGGNIFASTIAGNAAATLTIDGLAGSSGIIIGASGAGAVTTIAALTDPGETYVADEAGEIVMNATPGAASTFEYGNAPGGFVTTFAFRNPGGTVASALTGVETGDAIALAGSSVSSVTFVDNTGNNLNGSLSIVTNLGTTIFSRVSYVGNLTPTGYTLSTDAATGLLRIAFTSPPSSVFQTGATGSYGLYTGVYLWSNTANWVGGAKPANYGIATFSANTALGNPTGVDDIANLYLDTLTMPTGYLAVVGSLEIGKLSLGNSGGNIFASTIAGNAAATLTIDGLTGSSGIIIGASGAGAVTTIAALTDPGETYVADEAGEVVMNATPSSASTFEFGNAPGNFVTTFAFRNPGATVASALTNVTTGDSIALAGSSVSSVTFTDNTGNNLNGSLKIVTNLGTTIFSRVSYVGNLTPTGYTLSTDAATGLERVTFINSPSSVFQTGATGSLGLYTGVYLWSNTANWVGAAKPANGGNATFSANTSLGNPTGVDDIANLFLDKLTMPTGYLAVVGALEIGTLSLGNSGGNIFASTIAGNAAATLTIDGLAGSSGIIIGASGAGAVTTIAALTDPGETYVADEAGEIVMNATPGAASTFEYGNAPGGFVTTFAFRNPGGTVASALTGVETGDAIALAGSSVSSVTFVDNTGNNLNGSLSIVTNLGTTIFSRVSYVGNLTPTGYTLSTDAATGLLRIAFTSPPSSVFQTGATGSYGLYTGVYLWSNTANWVGGAKPANYGIATFSANTALGNPTGVDDIANLYLDTLTMPTGYLAVVGSLEIGKLSLGNSGGNIFASTIAGNAAATLTIDGLTGSSGIIIGASGAGAVTTIAALTDPGETYVADEAGEVVMNATPSSASTFEFGNAPGNFVTTFAFRNPGATVASALTNVTTGDSIALAGSSVSSVTFTDNTGNNLNGSLKIVTNLGTTIFSRVSYVGNLTPTGYTLSTDAATGLERVTFCFMAGTLIRTPDGEVPVEMLRRGDLVITSEGLAKPISWLGKQTVSAVFADPVRSWPVRVKAGALGENVPSRDLLLSPDHALLVDNVLIQAGALVNGTSILRETVVPSIFVYHHVELDDHSLILAENTPAETFIDNVDRMGFDNWAEHEALFPEGKPIEEMPCPRAKARRQVPTRIRAALDARANLIGAGGVAAFAC